MGFDYFYNREAERFLFYRIPHVFFEEPKFKALSSDAKILYALFFHRITLSLKKGWIDEYGRVYIIFTLEEIQMCIRDRLRSPLVNTCFPVKVQLSYR